jgi:two-component system, NarL family, sensor histidine kinase UhpB
MNNLKILYLEDSAQDAELAGYLLKSAGIDFTFKLVDTQDEYEEALKKEKPDIILADHSLYHFNSLEALNIFKRSGLKIPFILVTGTVSEEFAVKILKQGADDYLLKDNLARLPNAILSSIEKYKLDKERQEYMNNVIANETLMKEAQRLAGFGSWEADIITGEVKWSDEIFRICGYNPGEVRPGHDILLHHIHPEDRAIYQQAIYSKLGELDTVASELRVIDKKNNHKIVYFKTVVKRNTDGQLTRLLGFLQDLTEKREMEKALADQALLQQKLITEVTIEAQEKERNEIGKELHDNINQVLASVKMFLTMAMENPEKRLEHIARCSKNVNYAIEEIRKLSSSLVAPSLGDAGIISALEDLTGEIMLNNELKVELMVDLEDASNLDENMELMLYRIAQEQLNNIRKHARAKKAIITLRKDGDNLHFSISDDGVGFDVAKKAHGIGLKNIRSRVDFYSGRMNIISVPGKGSTISISIPYNK